MASKPSVTPKPKVPPSRFGLKKGETTTIGEMMLKKAKCGK